MSSGKKGKAKAFYYFATAADLTPGLLEVEQRVSLKYVETIFADSDEHSVYSSALDIPSLGCSPTGNYLLDPHFLVMPRDQGVYVRVIEQTRGGIKHALDRIANGNSLEWRPGGLHEGGRAVVRGEFHGNVGHPIVDELFRIVQKRLLKGFKKTKGVAIGPEALHLYAKGFRLTTNIKGPILTDLVID